MISFKNEHYSTFLHVCVGGGETGENYAIVAQFATSGAYKLQESINPWLHIASYTSQDNVE